LPMAKSAGSRSTRPLRSVGNEALNLGEQHVACTAAPGFFDPQQPALYSFARHAVMSRADKRAPTLDELHDANGRIRLAIDRETKAHGDAVFPAVVAAGELFVVPTLAQSGLNEIRPMMGPPGVFPHGSLIQGGSLGLAVMHLLWVIEQIELGVIPWSYMLAEADRDLRRR
jgi:hypothetical protein